MILDIIPLIVLGFAAYRITRFLVIDTFFEGLRAKLYTFLTNRVQKHGPLHLFWLKAYELSSCTWCAGFWVSVAAYTAFVWTSPLDFTRLDILNIFAVAGIQGLLHAFEPDEA